MSGWIKIDKDLAETIRFRRVVRKLRDNSNALRSVTDALAVTIVLGALQRFWIYADSHIGDDNTLSITPDEINEIVGIEGFAQALPADWLQVIDADQVKLPDFLEHNGSSEKQRRGNARRQAAYRHRHKSHNVTRYVTDNNASNDARPDQKRPEETRPEIRKSARETEGAWRRIRETYPKGIYREADWLSAEHAFAQLVERGESPEQLAELVGLYHAQQLAKQAIGSQFVLAPSKFFTENRWRGPFPLPATKADARLSGNIAVMQDFVGSGSQ